MQIFKFISNNIVICTDQAAVLDATGLRGRDWFNPTVAGLVTQDSCTALPANYIDNAYSYANGTWTVVDQAAVTKYTNQQIVYQWQAYQSQASQALSESDSTMQLVIEGVALGTCALTNADVVAYMNMRKALRVILSEAQPATIPTTLPTAPFPVGT